MRASQIKLHFSDVRDWLWLHIGRPIKIKGGYLAGILLSWGLFYHSISTANLQGHSGHHAKVKYCTREEIKQGRWMEITLPEAPYVPPEGYYKGVHGGSVCKDFSPTDFNTYEWVPHNSSSNTTYGSCIFDSWNASEFCSLGWTSIAIIGDSLSWEHYSALLMSLGLQSDPNGQFVSRRSKKSIFTMGCNGTLKLIYQRSDQLEYVPQVIREDTPQILILNKGSHPVNDEIYEAGWNQTISTLEEYERNLTKLGLPNIFFFRTTVPGHPQCETYTEQHNPNRSSNSQQIIVSGANDEVQVVAVQGPKRNHGGFTCSIHIAKLPYNGWV